VTYERQSIMRRHGYAMDDLSRIFDGRRAFDREEAVRLSKELEEGFSGPLVQNTPPGAIVAGSRTAPWTWNNFGTFQGYNEAARQSASRLTKALAKQPTSEEMRTHGIWLPTGRPAAIRPLGFGRDDAIPFEAVKEFQRLNATCYSCHMLFRGFRW
jgi:cytochrome c556